MFEDLKQSIIKEVNDTQSLDELKQIRVATLGKKGSITLITKDVKDKTPEERKAIGKEANELKEYVEIIIEQKRMFLAERKMMKELEDDKIDIFLPGTKLPSGSYHPLTLLLNDVIEFFRSLGYIINEGFEIEEDLYNFERLNMDKDHPARDMQDTFYFDSTLLLRTHTSSNEARALEENEEKGPIRMFSYGKCYRKDEDDATHSHQFMQIGALVVDEDISLSDLKGTLTAWAKHLFGENTQIRFRPSYFPFTEPSVEVDINCHLCGGGGCPICKHSGWIEILGSGVSHPNILTAAGYDADKYQAFAFGAGAERIAMLKYGVDDIRSFYNNNVEFLDQFNKVK